MLLMSLMGRPTNPNRLNKESRQALAVKGSSKAISNLIFSVSVL